MRITKDVLDEISDGMQNTLDVRFESDYSGRGMYGNGCFGLIGSMNALMDFTAAAADVLDEDQMGILIRALTIDNMGHDFIFYFPGVTTDEIPDEEDE